MDYYEKNNLENEIAHLEAQVGLLEQTISDLQEENEENKAKAEKFEEVLNTVRNDLLQDILQAANSIDTIIWEAI